MASAVGAGDAVILDVCRHLGVAHSGRVVGKSVCGDVFLDELVGSVTGFALLAVHERIGEAAEMS